jgi:POT family proton-dependent oligopeptide transporter
MLSNFSSNVKSFNKQFWFLSLILFLERISWWIILIQMPIYIAQKGVDGGLGMSQNHKGVIFFIWAVVQNLTTIFAGGYSEKIGFKKTITLAFVLIASGLLIQSTQKDYFLFLFGILIMGIGSGIFKPSLQGLFANQLNSSNSALAWAWYVLLINLGIFFVGTPLSKYFREQSFTMVFVGAALIIVLNLILWLLFQKNDTDHEYRNYNITKINFKHIVTSALEPRVLFFVLPMSGFMAIYFQFYETLPNFIFDWINTSDIVKYFALSKHFTMETDFGTVVTYEWIYNLNTGLVMIMIMFMSWILSKYNASKILIWGLSIATLGLGLSGISNSGLLLCLGIIVYTIGELIVNPKFSEKLTLIAGENSKAQYLGYFSISSIIGLGTGALSGGYLYGNLAEKSSLAIKYANQHNININHVDSFNSLSIKLAMSKVELTHLLWDTYNPAIVWLPFFIIGVISVISLIIYKKKYG